MVLCSTVRASEEPSPWRYIHPQAGIIVGGDLKKAQTSPLWLRLKKELGATAGKTEGLDVFAMVDRFVLSTPEVPSGDQPPALISLEGTFDRVRVRKALAPGTGIERFKGIDLYVPPKARRTDMLFALINDHLGLLGDRASMELVLTSPAAASPLIERAKLLGAHNIFWMVTDDALARALPGGNTPPALRDVDRLDLALSLDRGVDLSILIGAKSHDAAKAIAAMAESSKYMLASNPSQPGVALLSAMTVVVGANEVKLNWLLPTAQVEKTIVEMKSGLMDLGMKAMAGLSGAPQPVASLGWPEGARPVVKITPPPPAVPQKQTIRIVGLDNGDKEVVYTSPSKPGGPSN